MCIIEKVKIKAWCKACRREMNTDDFFMHIVGRYGSSVPCVHLSRTCIAREYCNGRERSVTPHLRQNEKSLLDSTSATLKSIYHKHNLPSRTKLLHGLIVLAAVDDNSDHFWIYTSQRRVFVFYPRWAAALRGHRCVQCHRERTPQRGMQVRRYRSDAYHSNAATPTAVPL